jgi:hypothetical protein
VYRRRLERLAAQGDQLARVELDATRGRYHRPRPAPVVAMVRLRSGQFSRLPLGGMWVPRRMPGMATTPAGALRLLTGSRQFGAPAGSGLAATGPPELRYTPEVEGGPAWLVPAWFPASDDPVGLDPNQRTRYREGVWLRYAWRFVVEQARGAPVHDAWNALAIVSHWNAIAIVSHWSHAGQYSHYTPVGLVYSVVPSWDVGGAHALRATTLDLMRRLADLGFGPPQVPPPPQA